MCPSTDICLLSFLISKGFLIALLKKTKMRSAITWLEMPIWSWRKSLNFLLVNLTFTPSTCCTKYFGWQKMHPRILPSPSRGLLTVGRSLFCWSLPFLPCLQKSLCVILRNSPDHSWFWTITTTVVITITFMVMQYIIMQNHHKTKEAIVDCRALSLPKTSMRGSHCEPYCKYCPNFQACYFYWRLFTWPDTTILRNNPPFHSAQHHGVTTDWNLCVSRAYHWHYKRPKTFLLTLLLSQSYL